MSSPLHGPSKEVYTDEEIRGIVRNQEAGEIEDLPGEVGGRQNTNDAINQELPQHVSQGESHDANPCLNISSGGILAIGTASTLGLLVAGAALNNSALEATSVVTGGITMFGTALRCVLQDSMEVDVSSDQELQEVVVDSPSPREIATRRINELMTVERYQELNVDDSESDKEVILEDLKKMVKEIFKDPVLKTVNNKDSFAKDLLKLFRYFRGVDIPKMTERFTAILDQKQKDLKNFIVELKSHVQNDWEDIVKTFHINPIGVYTIELSEGETHNNGKKVCFLCIDGSKVVYKPRDMRLDRLICGHQDSLFSKINSVSGLEPLPTYEILSKDGHGYAKFLSHKKNDYKLSLEDAKRYYQVLGYIEAISRVFGIRDLHRENIMVHEKLPYPIDFEVVGNIQSLLKEYKDRPTELQDAYSYNQPNEDWNSRVVIDGKIEFTSEQRLAEFKQGFEAMKVCLVKNKQLLYEFIKTLSGYENLLMRYVPIDTNKFVGINASYCTGPYTQKKKTDVNPSNIDYSEEILSYLRDSNSFKFLRRVETGYSEMEIAFNKTEEDSWKEMYNKDLTHVDVPLMTYDLEGRFFYKGNIIIDLSNKNLQGPHANHPSSSNRVDGPSQSSPTYPFVLRLLSESVDNLEHLALEESSWKTWKNGNIDMP